MQSMQLPYSSHSCQGRSILPHLRGGPCFSLPLDRTSRAWTAKLPPALAPYHSHAAACNALPHPSHQLSGWPLASPRHSATASPSVRRTATTLDTPQPATAPTHESSARAAPQAVTSGASGGGAASLSPQPPSASQPVDYSTLAACCAELREHWVPAKVEQVIMPDRTSLCLRLRTPARSAWLRVCWHPVAGRLSVMGEDDAPERGNAAELYSLVEQVRPALVGRVLVGVALPAAWERVAALRFGVRPGEPPSHTLYCEVMARYSNIILTDDTEQVLATAYQVGGMMSSHRQVQVGRAYALPPQLYGVPPPAAPDLPAWRDTLTRAAAMAAAQAAAAAAQRLAKRQQRAGAAASVGGAGGAQQQQQQQQQQQLGSAASAAAGAAAAAAPAGSGGGGAESASAASPGDGLRNGSTSGGEAGVLQDGFIRAFHGVSPALVTELCAAAGTDPRVSPAALDERAWAALYGEWVRWQERLGSGQFAASSDPGTGRYSVFGAYPRRHDSVHAMLEAYYGPMTAADAHAQLHVRLAGVVAAALKKARGKVRAFEQQLADSSRAEGVQRQADLITANLYRIPAGSSSAVVEDWESGEPLTLALDPTKPPVASAEALYRKARKLRRAVEAVAPLLEEASAEAGYLEEVEVSLASLKRWSGDGADAAALREVQDELVAGKYMKPPTDAALAEKTAARASKAAARAAAKGAGGGGKGKGKGGGKGAASAAAVAAGGGGDSAAARRYLSPGGFTVLVGRNNRQNDVLSTQVAADDDLWLHVRAMPGSHTLLRVPPGGRAAPGEADVQFAADLAAFYSKAKDALKVDVILTRGAWVRKPRGAKPGAVQVSKELRNVVARPGDSAAAREAGPAA